MAHTDVLPCDCCGLAVDIAQTEFCPRCQYPVQPEQEQRFLEGSLWDLKRVMRYGGSALSVAELVWRYEGRLHFLSNLKGRLASSHPAAMPAQSSEATPTASSVPQTPTPVESQPAVTWPTAPIVPPPVVARPAASIVPQPVVTRFASEVSPVMSTAPAASMRGFSLSSDGVVNLLAALGGFSLLAGSLSFVWTTKNLWLSFLTLFLLHAVFGAAGLITRRRFPLLRAVSPIYTFIFALLVPMVGYSAYNLVTGGLVALSQPALLTLAALYAAAIYTLLAVVQRFVPFAYLGMVALLVGDLALAQAWNLAYWWWPCLAMLLALPALLALPRSAGETWPFSETWAILRTPLQVLMYAVLGAACLSVPLTLLYSLTLDALHGPVEEMRVALLALACLLCAWVALWIWRTRRLNWTPLLAYLFLGTLLLLGYALRLELTGYVLLLSGTAAAYHLLSRVTGARLAPYGSSGLALDQLAVILSALVLLLVAALVPLQLLFSEYSSALLPALAFVRDNTLPWKMLALGICFLVTVDITALRAGLSRLPAKASWCWLLLLSGLILVSAYGLEVLFWQIPPLWAFLAFSVALLTSTVLVRRFASPAWSNPLDVLTLVGIAFTLLLIFSQSQEVISVFLLGFAALLYIVLLAQRRPLPSLMSAGLLLLALPFLLAHPIIVLGLALLLPLLVAGMQRAGLFEKQTPLLILFGWVLLIPALLYGLVLIRLDINSGQSVFAHWSSLPLAAGVEIAALGAAWYGAALSARVKLWLGPAALFWLSALLMPTNDFWVLAVLTPALAFVAMSIVQRAPFVWATPFALAALCGACMVGYTGFAQAHLAELSWVLLSYALLSYGFGLFTDQLAALWLAPLCATLAIIVAALLGDLYRPPVVALVCAGLGLAFSRTALAAQLSRRQRAPLLYALPLYATALAAALLTGVYGVLGNISRPFYGALPDALFLYALVACAILWFERWPSWNWLVAVFACWAVLLAQRLVPSYALGTGIGLVLLGLMSGRLFRAAPQGERTQGWANFTWSWPWYSAFVVAMFVVGAWPTTSGYGPAVIVPALLVFTGLAAVVMLVERAPEFLLFPAALAAWTLYLCLPASEPAVGILAYTALCALLFATQFIWRLLPAATHGLPATSLHNGLSLGGLCLVLLGAFNQGGLSPDAGSLAHAGVLALVTLSLLLGLYGLMYPSNVARTFSPLLTELQRKARLDVARAVRHWCCYGAGLLLALAVSWELLAFHQTGVDVLTLVPASYLIVVAPFLLRDQALPERRTVGQIVALAGAALLLLPSLWSSFNGTELLPTLLLLAEALLLLVVGLLTRLRIFILSSAGLLVIGILRLLFLAIQTYVPLLLMAFGALLILLATALILSRHRLQVAWSRWE